MNERWGQLATGCAFCCEKSAMAQRVQVIDSQMREKEVGKFVHYYLKEFVSNKPFSAKDR